MRRLGFRHYFDFVYMAPVVIGGEIVHQVGEKVAKDEYKRYHLRALYKRKRIGATECDWTKARLAKLEKTMVDPAPETPPAPEPEVAFSMEQAAEVAKSGKSALDQYAEQFGVKLDRRKTLADMLEALKEEMDGNQHEDNS